MIQLNQVIFSEDKGWEKRYETEHFSASDANLVLVFSAKKLLLNTELTDSVKKKYPNAEVVFCSTAGEIAGVNVEDNTLACTAIVFEKTKLKTAILSINDVESSFKLGTEIPSALGVSGLKHILLISDGQLVNGSELSNGISEVTPETVVITGGMAGDADEFNETLVGLNDELGTGNVVGIGFYGDNLKVGFGTMGGWDEFGPHRTVTKSNGNVLYELDDKNALDLYKKYLGPKANELPGSALLFPLSMKTTPDSEPLVRTILSINENDKSMTFAGDIPEGSTVRFMKSNFDRIIDGASVAALNSLDRASDSLQPQLVLLISCVGRKLVLDQRIEEEIEAVEEVFGENVCYCGFYSYGELSSSQRNMKCDLHNQTMTLTTYTES